MRLWIGTSGWQYRDWRGTVYPADVPLAHWLEAYAGRFPTVENNSAFYRLPARETFADWHARVPAGFVMAVKASRFLTHVKRLRDPAQPVARLLDRAAGLNGNLGPILLQLPPNLAADEDLLADCLREFPTGVRVAVEPRHPSWWSDGVRGVLERHGAALVWSDRRSRPVGPLWRTADWAYLRLHEGRAQPWPRYGRSALRSWVQRLAAGWGEGCDGFVYFNNDPGGAAVHDAEAMRALAIRSGQACRTCPLP